MRILVVEDDGKIQAFIKDGLKREGFVVETADNGIDGFHLASTESFDAAVVDIMLPRLDGLELVESLRKQNNKTPVLMLSAKNSVDDRVNGLYAGGDDYLTKPFAFAELLARLQALIRRATFVAEPTTLSVGDLAMDLIRRSVTRAGSKIDLQPREFALLEYLVRNKGRTVSKIMIMERVWGYNFDPQTNVVESRMSRLRDKIDRNAASPLIKTVRGVGYVISEEDRTIR